MQVVNLLEKFSLIEKTWTPGIVGELNAQYVKLAKLQGEFLWHAHPDEDELFLVVKGGFTMHFRDGSRALREGEMIIVPRGVEHKPEAQAEAWVLLFEPVSTGHTGTVQSERTVENQRWL